MSSDTSLFQLYLLRLVYIGNLTFLGLNVWPALLQHSQPWDPVKGAAFAFWGALSVLSALGIRYPLKMLPILLLQLLYKAIWLSAVAVPQWQVFPGEILTRVMIMGIVADVVAIPWSYLLENYVRHHGDRWTNVAYST